MIKLTEILNEQKEFKIFVDLDGVLADFDEMYKKSFKVEPHAYEDKYGKDAFWNNVGKLGIKFWTNMPWMPQGKKLWNYVKDKNAVVLSKASKHKNSGEGPKGKKIWIAKHLGNVKGHLVFGSKGGYAKGPNYILIDDLEKNIKAWKSNGGTAILFKSTADTIKQLKKLGV